MDLYPEFVLFFLSFSSFAVFLFAASRCFAIFCGRNFFTKTRIPEENSDTKYCVIVNCCKSFSFIPKFALSNADLCWSRIAINFRRRSVSSWSCETSACKVLQMAKCVNQADVLLIFTIFMTVTIA